MFNCVASEGGLSSSLAVRVACSDILAQPFFVCVLLKIFVREIFISNANCINDD